MTSIGKIGNKEIDRTNALTLTRDSKEYFDYYLRGRPNEKIDISKVSYFLLMRSLELALKALLKTKEGISTSDLKYRFKHNIYFLFTYSIKRGYLKSKTKEIRLAIEKLNSYYLEKDFEYTRIGYKELPYTSYIIPIIEEIHNELNTIFQTTGIKKYI